MRESKPFIPSGWHLMQQVANAMAKADAAREQAALKAEARADRRAELTAAAIESQRARRFWMEGQ